MEFERTPLIEYAIMLFADVSLHDVLLIASQHILDSNRSLFGYFVEKGLPPANIFLIGKCYSTNQKVFERFAKMGINVSKDSSKFDSYVSFDEQFDIFTRDFLEDVLKKVNLKKIRRVVILEDGGNLLSHANRVFKDFSKVVGIEQTSAGYEKLKNLKLNFPVVNVARSETKLKVESPLIADIFLEKLEEFLSKINLKPKKVLIVGSGAIGGAIYQRMKKRFDVYRYDLEEQLSDFKGKSLKGILSEFDIIIGTTGKAIIDLNSYRYLKKGVVLASASSSDREFSAVDLRKLVDKIGNCHKTISTKGINLLNCGFPVNFDGGENSSPLKEIQITLALLFSAVCLASSKEYKKGLVELDSEI